MRAGWIGVKGRGGYSEQIRKMRGEHLSVILLLILLLLPSITVAESAVKLQPTIVTMEEGALAGAESTGIVTWFEENDPAIAYTSIWNSLACPACSNGYLKYSGQTGAKAEFSFYGAGIKWHTAKAPALG